MFCCPKSNTGVKTPPKTMSEATWDTHTKHPPKPSHLFRLLEEDLQVQCPGQAAPLWVNYTWISRTQKERTMRSYTNTFLEGRDPIAFDSASHKSPKPGWNFIRDPSPPSTADSSTKNPSCHFHWTLLPPLTALQALWWWWQGSHLSPSLPQWLLFNDACPRRKNQKNPRFYQGKQKFLLCICQG